MSFQENFKTYFDGHELSGNFQRYSIFNKTFKSPNYKTPVVNKNDFK